LHALLRRSCHPHVWRVLVQVRTPVAWHACVPRAVLDTPRMRALW
jgi:hypothetical protein